MLKKYTKILGVVFGVSLLATITITMLTMNDVIDKVNTILSEHEVEITRKELPAGIKKVVLYGYGDTNFLVTPSETPYYEENSLSDYSYTFSELDENGTLEIYIEYEGYTSVQLTEEFITGQVLRSFIDTSTNFYIPNDIEIETRSIYVH